MLSAKNDFDMKIIVKKIYDIIFNFFFKIGSDYHTSCAAARTISSGLITISIMIMFNVFILLLTDIDLLKVLNIWGILIFFIITYFFVEKYVKMSIKK